MHVVILLCFKRAGVQGYFKTIFFTSLKRRLWKKGIQEIIQILKLKSLSNNSL